MKRFYIKEQLLFHFRRKKIHIIVTTLITIYYFFFFSNILLSVNRQDFNVRIEESKTQIISAKPNYKYFMQINRGLKESTGSDQSNLESLEYIRKWFLDPPSKMPYNLQESKKDFDYTAYKTMAPSWIFIDSILMDFFRDEPPGFFVEAGAADGEKLSNTLQLERKLNWTGLLVEGDKSAYIRLKKKNRKCWSSPVCLATKPHPHEVVFTSYPVTVDESWSGAESSRIEKNMSLEDLAGVGYPSYSKVLCIPTGNLLDALHVTHVDFFSLDVEGVEMEVLKNFPFDQVTVDVWAIEHVNPNDPGPGPNTTEFYLSSDNSYRFEDPNLIYFMKSKGYYFFDMFCQVIPDYIFVRIKSKLFQKLSVPENMLLRKDLCVAKKHWEPKPVQSDLDQLRDKRHWPTLKFY